MSKPICLISFAEAVAVLAIIALVFHFVGTCLIIPMHISNFNQINEHVDLRETRYKACESWRLPTFFL
jgi:hypothetical protein